mgnify:FL=1
MIAIKHLKYKYRRSETAILKDASLMVREGEIVALVGENGSGKEIGG